MTSPDSHRVALMIHNLLKQLRYWQTSGKQRVFRESLPRCEIRAKLLLMSELRRTLSHDWPIIALVTFNLAGIGLYLGVGPALQEGAGYRVIDIRTVQRLLDAGDLSLHEADWYQSDTSRKQEIDK